MSEAKKDDTPPAYRDIFALEDIIYIVKNNAQTKRYGKTAKKFISYP
jgi:hypothetical protein